MNYLKKGALGVLSKIDNRIMMLRIRNMGWRIQRKIVEKMQRIKRKKMKEKMMMNKMMRKVCRKLERVVENQLNRSSLQIMM